MDERLVTNPFTPALSPGDGPTSENGRVKQTELLANFDDVSYAIFSGRFYVSDRASDAANCDVWLENFTGTKQGVIAGEVAYIYYDSTGTTPEAPDHMWRVEVTEDTGDPYIRFSDAEVETPAVPAITYNNAGFIAAIVVVVKPIGDLVEKDRVVVLGAGALTGSDIARSSLDTEKIATRIDTLETQADSVIETAGGLKADVVEAANIKKTGTDAVFENDLPKNIVLDGSCEKFIYSPDIAYGIAATDVPAGLYAKEAAIVERGTYAQKFQTSAGGVGVKILIDPEEGGITSPGAAQTIGKNLDGTEVTLTCWYRADVADNIEIGFWDDVTVGGYQVTAKSVAINTYTRISATITIPAGVTEVYGIVRSTGVVLTDHYIDGASIYPGSTTFEVGQSVNSGIVHNAIDNRTYNYIPMGDFAAHGQFGDAWINGVSEPPLGWQGTGAAIAEATNILFNNASMEIAFAATEYLEQVLGLVFYGEFLAQEFRGKAVTFALWLLKDGANTEDLDLEIAVYDTTGAPAWNTIATGSFEVNEYDDWAQVAVTTIIPTAVDEAEEVRVKIINNGANPITAFIDGAMFTQTAYPISFTRLSPWTYFGVTFTLSGTVADGLMDFSGLAATEAYFSRSGMLYALTVYEGTGNTGTDVFYPKRGATEYNTANPPDFQVNLGSGVQKGITGDPDGLQQNNSDTLGIYCDADATNPGSNAQATLHFIRLAL